MRRLLASSIGVTCAAALALPLTSPATAMTVRQAPTAEAGTRPTTPTTTGETPLPGSTQSLPLAPLTRDRALGAGQGDQGLSRRDVARFSLLGVVWDDPDAELHGRVQVRTHAAGAADGTAWSGWQDVEAHNADHGADPGSPERASAGVRGATAPLWVGDSDGVEVRVHPDTHSRTEETGQGRRTVTAPAELPAGLRLELVDPGTEPATGQGRTTRRAAAAPRDNAAAKANAALVPLNARVIPALSRSRTKAELFTLRGKKLTKKQRTTPYIGPRPKIITRKGWGADESLRETGFRYTSTVKAAFVHHTATGNSYTCSEAPSVIRGIYRYHVTSLHWRDIGYNFLIDKCGTIYEGRAGGVANAVLGAHTLGFNTNSMGVAVLGTFNSAKPNAATVKAIAQLTAWKLGLFGADPKGKTYLKSGGGNLYPKGKNVQLNVISGHRDGFATECPGKQLYGKLGTTRSTAATYQGR